MKGDNSMKNERKENIIIVIVAIVLILGYLVFMKYQVNYWKHQNIAYEQYRTEDLRQARIYNYTFAKNEEEFMNKIKDIPEEDQIIAKALYEIKPEIETIKQQRLELLESKNKLTDTLKAKPHDIMNDTRTSLLSEGITTLEQYLETYNIRGSLYMEEYSHIVDMFGPYVDKNMTDDTFGRILAEYNINSNGFISREDNPNAIDYDKVEKELEEVNSNLAECEEKLSNINKSYNELIKENSNTLEYQETITTNGIKSAIDYLTNI